MQHIPKRYRAQFTDRFINYVRETGEMMIQMELVFDSHLDVDRLKKALDLTLDAEPVLGCRFVKNWWRPRWERLDTGGREVLTLADSVRPYEEFMHAPINIYTGPQVKACLLRDTKGDRLLIKVAHEVSDASGVRQIVKIISSTYSRLAHEPEYRPEPNINGDRSIWQALRNVPLHAYPVIWYNYYRIYTIPTMYPVVSIHLPIVADNDRKLEFISRRVPENLSQRIIDYGRQRNATLNDVILAAYFHAVTAAADWNRKSQLRLRVTVDLRRYKKDVNKGGICNLSGMEVINLGTDLNSSDFDYTLKRISTFMEQRKAKWIGINDYVGLAPSTVCWPHSLTNKIMVGIIQSSVKSGQAPYTFTNMGAIEQKDVTFDKPPVEARLLPPVNYPPVIMFCLSSYNGTLTISSGSYPCSKKHLDRCLDEMVTVLNRLP
jgi:NRPS condensation-like uncharacterized protein